jgi:diacylglycerol kinase (ATP)
MRVTLLHNPKAGQGRHGKRALINALENAGHNTLYRSTKKKGWEQALEKKTDVVLTAGGDGTIAKVASKLIDRGVPLAILPLGTANNLARSLGLFASPKRIITQLAHGKKRTFDVGVAHGPWGERYFFEGAGAGLLADYVEDAKEAKRKKTEKQQTKNLSKEQDMARHVARLRRKLQDYPAQKWKIELDGKDISGSYILWEAMNIRSVGPALYLAPWAATKDGELDFVAAREEDREILMKHLDARLAGEITKFPLPMRKFRKLKIVWEGSTLHFGDEIWPQKETKTKRFTKIKIEVKSSALLILQPPKNSSL